MPVVAEKKVCYFFKHWFIDTGETGHKFSIK